LFGRTVAPLVVVMSEYRKSTRLFHWLPRCRRVVAILRRLSSCLTMRVAEQATEAFTPFFPMIAHAMSIKPAWAIPQAFVWACS